MPQTWELLAAFMVSSRLRQDDFGFERLAPVRAEPLLKRLAGRARRFGIIPQPVVHGRQPALIAGQHQDSPDRPADLSDRVVVALDAHPGVLERCASENWALLPFLIADRFGLLITGDVRVVVDSLIHMDSDLAGRRTERIVNEPRPRSVLEFALGCAYQELRYQAGLSARPKVV